MIIENLRLIECIKSSILEYNNQFYKKEDEDKKIDLNCIEYSEDEESANIPEEILNKLETLRIALPTKNISKEELDAIIKQLSDILDITKLKAFSFSVMNKGQRFENLDMSFLEHLNEDIENLSISGIDLSQETSNIFEKFKSLRYLNLRKCNITNPQIISKTNPETFVKLEQNKIAPEYYFDAISLIKKSNGRINFDDKNLEKITEIYRLRQVELRDFLQFGSIIDFENISDLTITARSEDLPILKEVSDIRLPVTLVIKNVNELSLDKLQESKYISTIQISDGRNTEKPQSSPYSRQEYTKVREEIDKIISQVKLPEENDPDREKKIFSQVYKILGKKIEYDNYAISKEGKKDDRLQTTCRNLLGGLLENKCVCAGYADILRNVLACTGIYSEFIGASPDFENGVPYNLKDPSGHAWNLVKLDGKKYWTDLTWDANNIKSDRYPLEYCLKSTKEFGHNTFKKRIEDQIQDPCLDSITDDEQVMLFTGKKLEDKNTSIHKQENKNIGYLSSCIMSIANEGLTSPIIRKAANELNTCIKLKTVKHNEMEVTDGR